ncbi:unnamed protein product, partial [Adineta steineri]
MASFNDMGLFDDLADDGVHGSQHISDDDLPSEDDDDDDDDDDDELDTTDIAHVN